MDGWKKRLADLDQEGSPEIRTCVVQATLEHLLEQRHFRKYFSDRKKDPILRMAYEEAFLWIKAAENPIGKAASRQVDECYSYLNASAGRMRAADHEGYSVATNEMSTANRATQTPSIALGANGT
jgi:hypothetical protein